MDCTNRDDRISFAHEQIEDFCDFANSFTRGYLKEWKACGILVSVVDWPNEYTGKRLLNYVSDCLEMEGYHESDCIEIANWIEKRFENVDEMFPK